VTGSSGRTQEVLEFVAAMLLALATIATAWSGYQASRWNGEEAEAFSRASAARIESTKAADLADSQTQLDVMTFVQWVNAYAQGQSKLANFYNRRFRAEFKPAVDAWIATRPLVNSDAPPTPFAMPEYHLRAHADAQRLDAEAESWSAKARANVQRATNYVLCVVLFAGVLFFAGMSMRTRSAGPRRLLLAFGVVLFVGTVVWLATFPVSVSI
jgi:hypothetical protein